MIGKTTSEHTHARPSHEVRDMVEPDMRITFRKRFRFAVDSRLTDDFMSADCDDAAAGERDVAIFAGDISAIRQHGEKKDQSCVHHSLQALVKLWEAGTSGAR